MQQKKISAIGVSCVLISEELLSLFSICEVEEKTLTLTCSTVQCDRLLYNRLQKAFISEAQLLHQCPWYDSIVYTDLLALHSGQMTNQLSAAALKRADHHVFPVQSEVKRRAIRKTLIDPTVVSRREA